MDLETLFNIANTNFGTKNPGNIVGITGYWDKMALKDLHYAHVDQHGRKGVVVAIELFTGGISRSKETWSLFQRYSNPSRNTGANLLMATASGQREGHRWHYARGLEWSNIGFLENWETLLLYGSVDCKHIDPYSGLYSGKSTNYTYRLCI